MSGKYEEEEGKEEYFQALADEAREKEESARKEQLHLAEVNSKLEKLRNKVAQMEELLEMVVDNTKMPHQHIDLQTRLYCLSGIANEILKTIREIE